MHFPRTKLIEKFNELLISNKSQYIVISGEAGIGKFSFIGLLNNADSFGGYEVEHIVLNTESSLESVEINNKNANLIIINNDFPINIIDIQTFIESNLPDSRIIFTSDAPIIETNVINFQL